MKTYVKNLFLLAALMAGLGLMLAGRVTAQTLTNLHSFTATADPPYTNSDGSKPSGGLVQSGNTLYGTASAGGIAANGTLFKVNADGLGFTNLHTFTTSRTNASGTFTNSDGATPSGGLILSGNSLSLYGTAKFGGTNGNGTVFVVSTNGTGFTNLHTFTAGHPNLSGFLTNTDGATPYAGLILSGNTLYGTTYAGGSENGGTVFAVNTDGTGFTNLHTFTGIGSDGFNPRAGLIRSGGTLFGTTANGGSLVRGMVFAVNTDGTDFTNLHSFAGPAGDGSNPYEIGRASCRERV